MISVTIESFYTAIVAIVLVCLSTFSPAFGQEATQIAKAVFPSVLVLEMRNARAEPTALGSGFFVRTDVIATNLHVIEGATAGTAKIVGSAAKYKIGGVVAIDRLNDLVLLKLEHANGRALALADVSKLEVGQKVFAIGNPKGLEGTISDGIISGLGLRRIENENLIQITAPISAGSSGGPILDQKGEVVGVAVASFKDGQNLNFAIPSSNLATLIKNIKEAVPLSSVTMPLPETVSRASKPSLSESAAWLKSTLEGTRYSLSLSETSGRSLLTIKAIRFSGCNFEMETYLQSPRLSTVHRMGASLRWVDNLYPGMPILDGPRSVVLEFDREVPFDAIHDNGGRQVLSHDFVKIPVESSEMSARVRNAFDHMIQLCKNDVRKDPF